MQLESALLELVIQLGVGGIFGFAWWVEKQRADRMTTEAFNAYKSSIEEGVKTRDVLKDIKRALSIKDDG